MKGLSLGKIMTYIKVSLPWYICIPVFFFSVIFPIMFGCDTYQDIGIMLDKSFSIIAIITFSNVWHIEIQQKTVEVYKLLPDRSRIIDILRRIAIRFIFLKIMICIPFIGYSIKGIHMYDTQETGASMCISAFLSIESVILLFGSISFFCVNMFSSLSMGIGMGIAVWMIMISNVASKMPVWFNFFAYGVRADWFKGAITATVIGILLFITGTIMIKKINYKDNV